MKAKIGRYEELKRSSPFALKLVRQLKLRAQNSIVERKKRFAKRMPSEFVQRCFISLKQKAIEKLEEKKRRANKISYYWQIINFIQLIKINSKFSYYY